MASSVDVVPALGHGLVTSQVGPSAGFDAIDDRRFWSAGLREGALSAASYLVSQRAAGANMTVDVAASTGDGALVQGDSVTGQGLYKVAPHTAVINVDIAAANATNPRVDIVILEVKDDAHDVGGLNIARVRVVSGTATSGATLDNRTGAPALPSSALHLADVHVPATDTTISDSQIRDKRVILPGGSQAGKCIIATTEARTNTAFGLLTTPDVVRNIVLPTDGLIVIAFHATWQESVTSAAAAAIFIGADQLKGVASGNNAATAQQASHGASPAASDQPLFTGGNGLVGSIVTSGWTDATTGQLIGGNEISGPDNQYGGVCHVFAAAGTYDISVQFKSTSGSVTAKNRKLWVWTMVF